MEPHPHDDGPVERGVGLAMTAAVEAVAPRRHPGRSRDGAGPAKLGEGGFRMNPIGGVAKDDQQFGGGVGTDAEALTQRRLGLAGESTQVTVVVHDFDGESEPATGERPEGMFRRGGRRIDRAAAPPSAAAFEERLVGERVAGLSQRGRHGDDDLLQRDHRRVQLLPASPPPSSMFHGIVQWQAVATCSMAWRVLAASNSKISVRGSSR